MVGLNSPSPDKYNTIDVGKYKQRSLQKVTISQSPTRRGGKITQTDGIPYYDNQKAHKFAYQTEVRNFSLPKSPRFAKDKEKGVVGVGKYTPSYKVISAAPSGSITARRR